MRRTITALALLTAAAAPIAGCGSSPSQEPAKPTKQARPAASPAPAFDPSRFVRQVDNPWFPLIPGSVYRYRGEKDGKPSTDVMTVTHRTRDVGGVAATLVLDRLYERGRLAEDTSDFYGQDRDGNVWYLGEATRELDRSGRTTSTEGSWETGVHGAEPGIFMPAHPAVGQSFRQEYLKGQAEDHFAVVAFGQPVKVPGVHTTNALRTKEWTPVEPGVIDAKYYVRGIGTVLEQTVKGGNERNELVSFKRG
ncbi:MAG: hypothetical protein ACJ760_05315 [Thermoleophilaceae bacterium]